MAGGTEEKCEGKVSPMWPRSRAPLVGGGGDCRVASSDYDARLWTCIPARHGARSRGRACCRQRRDD